MSESFTLEISYKGIIRKIPCVLRVSAYTYQILCQVDDSEIILEKSDDGTLRAVEADAFSSKNKKADIELIRLLSEEMERILQ